MINRIAALAVLGSALALGACSDAEIASSNLSKAADNFEINRRVIFINGVTNDYMLTIEGLCSLGSGTGVKAITVTCKTGPAAYKKHYMGLSDNVTYIMEQLEAAPANVFHYRVIFKPAAIVPSFELRN